MEPNNPLAFSARLKQGWTYLPFLLWPLAISAVVIYYKILLKQHPNDTEIQISYMDEWIFFCEWIAPWLLTATTAIYWGKAIFTRNPTYVIFTVLAGCLLLRELHWDHMIKVAIYPLLVTCFVWLFLWRDVVDKPTHNWWNALFFFAAIATYGLAQMVEKKVIGKHIPILPDFKTLHTQFEEISECSGHVLLLLAAVLGSWRRKIMSVK